MELDRRIAEEWRELLHALVVASPGMMRLNRGAAASVGGSGARIPSGVGSCGVRSRSCRDRISSRVGTRVVSGVGAGGGTGVCPGAVAVHARTSDPKARATILRDGPAH